jgi:xylulose-5-phosphate/fructose-6-phosphate phosphoketolase
MPTDELDEPTIDQVDATWRAANYLTVGQIYLRNNPLVREPLAVEHIKPRLLGHWGTSTGLSLLYAHFNRVIRRTGRSVLFVTGPGHGGPALVANVWLEGTYSEIYDEVPRDLHGMTRLFRQFSTPGGIPSHVSVPTPGSIHEGGELGYALVHGFGAVFDNPDLLVACVVGDGEAETAPLEGAWKSIRFLNPARDGAVLPILHLNEYKISGPTVLGRADDDDIRSLLSGHGYEVTFVEGNDPMAVHHELAAALDGCIARIDEIQADARARGAAAVDGVPRWPALVLRTPKGWTGPKEVDGLPVEGTFRSHQVPVSEVATNPEHLAILESWLHSYRPEELFDEQGRPVASVLASVPEGPLRMGANPNANGGRLLVALDLPEPATFAVPVASPATERRESTRSLGEVCKEIYVRNRDAANFRLFCPDETNSNRLGAVFDVENRCWPQRRVEGDDHLAPDGRVMEVLSEHLCQGWLEAYLLTGRHGLFATYEAFAMVSASMLVQHAKWLEHAGALPWRRSVASMNVLLTSTCWRNDHNGFSHQGPGLIDVMMSKKGNISRIYLPPDANCLLSVADHCFRSHNYVNLVVIDKQPQLQYLDMDAANIHCTRGLGIWEWASVDDGRDPDVVLACAGDIPTMETVAAAWLLRQHLPDLRVRVVNVVDLMRLFPADSHPHGMDGLEFNDYFTADRDVVFAFHGYARAIHELVHGHNDADRFHVRGFLEEGTTTTPFDMVVLNNMSRYHLAKLAVRRARRRPEGAEEFLYHCDERLAAHRLYVAEHFEDLPDVRDWTWTD